MLVHGRSDQQVFRTNGTFVKEFFTERSTRGNGSAYNAGLSPDRNQTYLYNADGENQHIWTFLRESGQVLSKTGRGGRQAGGVHRRAQPGGGFKGQHLHRRSGRGDESAEIHQPRELPASR